ncbi:hypothetical protein [Allobaculum sp. JKK-2023]|uniref:hypothetical protein n=1 Tax=Allobaculum sp. JKK-2023 TaxID=3108943 RepID=UPI002B05B461|nr:hypothetical protein [Allobaculum sp. JKK-2023]
MNLQKRLSSDDRFLSVGLFVWMDDGGWRTKLHGLAATCRNENDESTGAAFKVKGLLWGNGPGIRSS